jgi:hypothetical protein
MSTYKLTFKNRLVVTIADVLSETEVDAEVYDLTNYRDDISGGGGSLSHVATAYTDNADNIDNAADATSTALPSVLYRKASAPYEYTSISDALAHVAPRHEKKKRTKLKLWSGAGGTGNLLYSAWTDRLESWGVATTVEYV